jgi:hypothetical protein
LNSIVNYLRCANGILLLLLLLLLIAIELPLGDSSPYTSLHTAKMVDPSFQQQQQQQQQ